MKHSLKLKDIDLLIKEGKRVLEKDFLIIHSEKKEKISRFGISLSKAKIKKAVIRNKVKRVIREKINYLIKNYQINKDFLIVYKIDNVEDKNMEQLYNVIKKISI